MFEMPTESEPVRIHCGDCLEVMKSIDSGSIDAVITDPPYGMKWNTDITRFSGGNAGHRGINQGKRSPRKPVDGDDIPFDPSPFLQFPKAVLWGSNHYAARLPVGTTLVWVKRNDSAFGAFLSDAEVAWMKGGHGVYLHRDLSMNAITRDRQHPTQKPVDLMRWCIQKLKLKPGSLILDPFAGSGTTGIAAISEGMRCILIEKDAGYVDIARRRVAEAMGTGLLSTLSGTTG